jgi:hypothetical protein
MLPIALINKNNWFTDLLSCQDTALEKLSGTTLKIF